jgi:excisionase family DNA binding protein
MQDRCGDAAPADLARTTIARSFFSIYDSWMTAVLEHTVLPPADDAQSLSGLMAVLEQDDRAVLVGSDGTRLVLPGEVYEALRDVVTAMANGQAITIAPHDTILTTQEAANLLGISRPTLVRLLEAGEIPFTQPGRHRRVSLVDLITYQHSARHTRRLTLDAMTNEAAEDDSYDRVNGFVQRDTLPN